VAAEPVSVPAVRRFVTDGLLAWGEVDLLDDARLCVTELCANAALHARGAFMEVSVQRLPDAIRLAVSDEDAGPLDDLRVQAQANADRPAAPPRLEVTTGRGLYLVQALAKAWGVLSTSAGKLVWADVSSSPDLTQPRPSVNPEMPPAEAPLPMPGDWRLVQLLDCPVELSLRQDQHLDELIRELQLVDVGTDPVVPPARLSQLMSDLLAAHAHARHTGRRAALQAKAAGDEVVTIQMPALAALADDVLALHAATQAADELCEARALLTLAAEPEVRLLRSWMTETIVDQVRAEAAPVAWAEWRASHDPEASA
jgi:anti-sigma regulatory factor (Ser/Thr protein kinase)